MNEREKLKNISYCYYALRPDYFRGAKLSKNGL